MFSVYLHDDPESLRIQLIGDFAGPAVAEARSVWLTARSAAAGRKIVFDLAELRIADTEGILLLEHAAAEGGLFITATSAGEATLATFSGLSASVLPAPRLKTTDTMRCWWGRLFGSVQPSIRKCLACGCMLRKLWVQTRA